MPPAVIWTRDVVLTLGMYSYGLNPANSMNIFALGSTRAMASTSPYCSSKRWTYACLPPLRMADALLILGMLQKDAEMERPRVPMHHQWHGGMRRRTTLHWG